MTKSALTASGQGFLAELGALPDGAPIDLRLNSPGGSVFDAVAIFNALTRHDGTITVWIDGIAASAASYVAMAGDEIVMPENAFLMIHDPSGIVMGTAADMRDMAATMDKIAGSMVRGYAARSGKSEEEIATLMAAETWFDAKDALDLGLATRMAEPVRIAASFDIARFRNAPPELASWSNRKCGHWRRHRSRRERSGGGRRSSNRTRSREQGSRRERWSGRRNR
jgi:ATP-dependent Clp protease, protease subunit